MFLSPRDLVYSRSLMQDALLFVKLELSAALLGDASCLPDSLKY
jgi:hypothetical protein